MASNSAIAKNILQYSNGKSASEIDKIVAATIKIYGNRSKAILRALSSKIKLADSYITIITADRISLNQKQDLANALSIKVSQMHFMIDQEIIGGIIVKMGDNIIDNSIATRISKTKDLIVKVQVN